MNRINRRTVIKLMTAALVAAQAACVENESEKPTQPKHNTHIDPQIISERLVRLARDLFPHGHLSLEKYQDIIAYFYQANTAVADSLAKLLADGEQGFESMEQQQRHQIIESNLFNPALLGFRFSVLIGLYNDLDVTREFGYQGPSINEGGYLNRGFDDIDWLPE